MYICAIGGDGAYILHNEPWDRMPFAVCSPDAHAAASPDRAARSTTLTEDLQVVETTLMLPMSRQRLRQRPAAHDCG